MRELRISCGSSYYAPPQGQSFTWTALVALLTDYAVGDETVEQYAKLSKDEQLKRKDVGWWNGAHYSAGRRAANEIIGFDVLTLDIDTGGAEIADQVEEYCEGLEFAYFLGSTRKHTPEKPRLRLAVPLSRTVSPDEAEALKRALAQRVGMDAVDPVSFRPNQVMFWPSRSLDGQTHIRVGDFDFLDVDAALARWYKGAWLRRELWPIAKTEQRSAVARERGVEAKRAGDPREKPGLIGAWCRQFSVHDAIERFLGDVYVQGTSDGRYTHVGASTANGVIVYDDGRFIYSNHATDPAAGQLLNAWDMVRQHKFGPLDAQVKPGTSINNLPSQKAMEAFALVQNELKELLAKEAVDEFDYADEDATAKVRALAAELDRDRQGKVLASHENLLKMVRSHPTLAGALAWNHNNDTAVWLRFMPWHDATRRSHRMDESTGLDFLDIDELHVREFLCRAFGGDSKFEHPSRALVREVIDLVVAENGFHPIRNYITGLPQWDGQPRLDSFLPRFLGVEDNPYHRGVGRKILIAAIKRMMEPGCKFDYMPILIGDQGVGKSRFIAALSPRKAWFTDSVPPPGTKDAVDQIRPIWIVEVGELANMKRAEIEVIKAWCSRPVDRARLAYERRARNMPRQCIFIGSTNDRVPLQDQTGNRRFWPIEVNVPNIDVEQLEREREQLYAEAVIAWRAGESIFLEDDAEELAGVAQLEARASDPMNDMIDLWLDGEAQSKGHTREAGPDFDLAAVKRDRVCVRQIAIEALGYDESPKAWPPWLHSRIINHLRSRPDFVPFPTTARIQGYGPVRVFDRVANVTLLHRRGSPVDDL